MNINEQLERIDINFKKLEIAKLAEIAGYLWTKKAFAGIPDPYIFKKMQTVPHDSIFDIRILCLVQLMRQIDENAISGDLAEVGVFRGQFAKLIHMLMPQKEFYLFDTFAGFDENQLQQESQKYKFADDRRNRTYANTSIELVRKTIISDSGGEERLHFVPGLFPDTADQYKDHSFCFVSLDVDLFQPTLDGLEFFYPRLASGGIIMVHDCTNVGYPGAGDGLKEFCKKHKIGYATLPDWNGSAVITKG